MEKKHAPMNKFSVNGFSKDYDLTHKIIIKNPSPQNTQNIHNNS